MKTKTILIAALLVVVIAGAAILYGALGDRAGLAGLPALNQNGQQADDKGTPPQEGQQDAGAQDASPGQGGGQQGSAAGQGGGQQGSATGQGGGQQGSAAGQGGGQQGSAAGQGGGQQGSAAGQGGGNGASNANDGSGETGGNQTGDRDDEDFMAPDFTVQDADGNDVRLSDLFGKPIVVNFWASWCPPCKAEMPEFNKVFGELGGEIQFMMVCLVDGRRETVETGAAYVEENGYTFPVYYDVDREAAMTYAVSSIPATYFIDAGGFLITGARGAIDEDTLRLGIDMAS